MPRRGRRCRYNREFDVRTIAHISDLHFGSVDPAIAASLAADLKLLAPHVLVVSGDFTQRGRRKQFAAAAAFLQDLPRPQIVVPGNHDIPLFDVIRRFAWPLERYRASITDDLSPFYRDEEIAVLGINTARSWSWSLDGFWKDGRISAQQLQEVQRRLSALPPEIFRIVVTHHPFIPPPGWRLRGMVGGAHRALQIMHSCGVAMLLAGHLHLAYSGDVRAHYEAADRSILSIQAGTAISTRRRDEPNAYNLITIAGPEVEISLRTWNGQHFEQTILKRYARVDGLWRETP